MNFNHVYELHHLLTDRRTPLPLSDILNALEIQKATFHRIQSFMKDSLNAPLCNEKGRGYYYATKHNQPPYELPGLWFTPQELTALSLLEQLLEASQPALLPQLLQPVKDKMAELLAVQGIDNTTCQQRLRLLPQWQRPSDPTTFTRISQALLKRKQLRIHYHNRHAQPPHSNPPRTISPQQLIYYRDNWYLDAWCHLKEALRTFAIDQIQQAISLEDSAKDIDAEALNHHYSSSYGIFAGEAAQVAELEFTQRIAPWVSREQWHPQQSDEWSQSGHYRLKVPYNNPTELILDILRYGADVKVLAPESLRTAVKQQLAEALKQYE